MMEKPMLVLVSFTFAVWATYLIKVIWSTFDRDE